MTTMASSGREEREMIVTVSLGASGRSLEDIDDGFGVWDGNIWGDMVNSLPSCNSRIIHITSSLSTSLMLMSSH